MSWRLQEQPLASLLTRLATRGGFAKVRGAEHTVATAHHDRRELVGSTRRSVKFRSAVRLVDLTTHAVPFCRPLAAAAAAWSGTRVPTCCRSS